jgi:putative SOS response-associated peptidase YedK
MLVILGGEAEKSRLDPGAFTDSLHSLLLPYSSERMQAGPASTAVNNVKNQGPSCLEPSGSST